MHWYKRFLFIVVIGCLVCSKNAYSNDARVVRLTVESVHLEGLVTTRCEYVFALLQIRPGDVFTPDDVRFESARIRLLASGIFESVDFRFRRGRKKGYVQLVVRLQERNTLQIRHLFFGMSRVIPFWFGLGLQERNFDGQAMRLSVSAVGTATANIMEGQPQYAMESSIFLPQKWKIPVHAGVRYASGTEFYRTYGDPDDGNPSNFLSLSYQRGGFWTETFFPIGPFFFHLGLSSELLYTDLPAERIRHYPDGTSRQIRFNLEDGLSFLGFLSGKFTWDTRNRDVLPSSGTLVEVSGRLGSPMTFSSYTYTRGEFVFEHYTRWGRHIGSVRLFAGGIMGSPSLFDKFYIGDLQDLVAPRALDLNLSVAPSPNFLNTGITENRWGTTAFKLSIRYDYPLFSRYGFIYRGHFFVSAGIVGLASPSQLRYRESSLRESLPLDLTFDFGLHVDTSWGIFRFSIANALTRMPF